MTLKTKRIFLITSFLIFFALLIVAGYEEYSTDKKRLYESIDQKLKSAAFGTSFLISDNYIARSYDGNISKEEDFSNVLKLSKFAKYIGVEYVYVVIKKNEDIIFVASSSTDEEMASGEDILNFDSYEDASKQLKLAFEKSTINYEEYKDKWGEFRSVFIPLKTNDGKSFVVCADIRIDEIEKVLATDKIIKGLKVSALIFFGFILFYWQLAQINKTLKLKNESLSNEQNLLLAIFDNGETILLKWNNDANKNVQYASKSIEKLLGVASDDFIKHKFSYFDFVDKDDLILVDQNNLKAIEQKLTSVKHNPYKIQTNMNEQKIVIDETFFAYDKNGKIEYCLSCIVDITAQMNREKVLFEQSKLASMGEMMGNIAHHWRQPLSGISMIASSMQFKQEMGILADEELEKNLDDIIVATNYLSETIDIFRDFIKDGQEKSKINITTCLFDISKLILPILNSNKIELQIKSREQELYILANHNEIEHAILNIITNSKDAILLNKIEDGFIEIFIQKSGSNVFLEISDNGGGIKEEIIGKIFEPYFTTKHQAQGVGLGLHMSRHVICDSLGGKIYASNIANGTKITIEIPVIV